MEHKHYVQELEAFLRTCYPVCIPIPSLNNMKPTSPKKRLSPKWAKQKVKNAKVSHTIVSQNKRICQ